MLESREEQKIIRELAIKYNKTEKEIVELITSVYKQIKEKISTGNPVSARVPHLGVFRPKSEEVLRKQGILLKSKDDSGRTNNT